MKSKLPHFIFFILISVLVGFACDKINDPLTLVDQKNYPLNPDDTLYFTDSVVVTCKQVLLEDFTGHKCVNCPSAAKMLHEMIAEHQPRLISYAVHAGSFAEPVPDSPFENDLRSSLSETLFTDFGIFANPVALIDRIEFNGLRQIFTTDWNVVVEQQLQSDNSATMKIKNTYFPKLNIVVTDVEVDFLNNLEGQYNLVVYVVEDHIVSPQMNNDPTIGPDTLLNFEHHNVLRAAISSNYGDPINPGGNIIAGSAFSKRYSYQLNEEWIACNCKTIAYIGKTHESLNLTDIIQVGELGIKTDGE
ncbi:MAG TPA: Omp28-related outer membrane protein [Bacteroidales bacterium]|nr:Omp28-related outer membrane protein [Bacteroidales bacterium]